MLLENYLNGFKRHALHERNLSSKVIKDVISSIKQLSKELEISSLNKLSTDEIRNYLYNQLENRNWAPRTLRNQRQYIKIFFNYCVSHGYLKVNPVDKISRPKLPSVLPRFLTLEQVNQLLISVETYPWRYQPEKPRNKAIIYTLLFTGIRLNELVNLKIADVNMTDREIIIRKGKGRKQRMIPIHTSLYSVLQSYLEHLKRNKVDSEWLFQSVLGKSNLKARGVQGLCEKLSKKLGFKFSPHWLRHTFGRNCTNAEISAFKIKEMMGHSDISTTQIYQSVAKKSLKDSFCNVPLI